MFNMKTKKAIAVLILLISTTVASMAQGIPNQWEFINNYTQLQMGKKGLKNLYNDSIIRKIDLVFPQANYWQLMQQNKNAAINIPATLTYEGTKVLDSVGVRFKGNTSYSRVNGDKKSFNIELDWIKNGADISGYSTMNLNNAFQDESFLREVMYTYSIRRHIPGLKANFSQLTINGQDWGLYPNVQQLNKDLYSDWFTSNDGVSFRAQGVSGGGGPGGGPQWGDGTTALNYRSNPNDYQTYYVLKYSDYANPYDELATLCDKLNNTSLADLEDTMKVYMDLDRTLWFLASEIAFTDDDGYVYKGKQDYYVFKEQATGQFVPMEFDGNSPMAMNKAAAWSPFHNENKVNYPLLNRLLQVPSIRQRYLAHMRTIIAEELDQTAFETRLNYYVSLIDTAVQSDPKKLYSYNDFTSEVNVLKNFVSTRRNSLNSNSEVSQSAPTISSASHYTNNTQWARPNNNQTVDVKATVSSTNGISAVNIYYCGAIYGQFTKALMYDDGAHNDGAANDGVFGATIPGFSGGTWVRYYVEAVSNNAAKSVSYLPVGAEHDVFVYLVVPPTAFNSGIVINEIMASNTTARADNNGDFDDWIELYNTSNNTIDISGWTITDDQFNLTKHVIDNGTTILPGAYHILWADEDGSQGADHINFKLSASGEELLLLNPNKEIVDELTWGALPTDESYARSPNATGNFIVKYHTFAHNNDWPLGVEDMLEASQIAVYPNPANSQLIVSLPGYAVEKLDEIEVLDITGKKLISTAVNHEVQISTASLANGMYILKCGNVSKKFVVQH